MSRWVVAGSFHGHEPAEQAINDLVRGGAPREGISVVARDEVYQRAIHGGVGPQGEKMPADAAARVAGLDQSAEPGMGSLLVVGPLAELLAEPALAAQGHPLAAALARLGLPSDDAERGADEVRRGAVLVVVEAGPTQAEAIRHLLREAGAVALFDGAHPA